MSNVPDLEPLVMLEHSPATKMAFHDGSRLFDFRSLRVLFLFCFPPSKPVWKEPDSSVCIRRDLLVTV